MLHKLWQAKLANANEKIDTCDLYRMMDKKMGNSLMMAKTHMKMSRKGKVIYKKTKATIR